MDFHISNGIRTHDPCVRVGEDCSCRRPRGHWLRPCVLMGFIILISWSNYVLKMDIARPSANLTYSHIRFVLICKIIEVQECDAFLPVVHLVSAETVEYCVGHCHVLSSRNVNANVNTGTDGNSHTYIHTHNTHIHTHVRYNTYTNLPPL
jgi:hypothetical protein